MPGQVIDRPNPQPLPSLIPEFVDELLVKLGKPTLSPETKSALEKFRRAANYIAAVKLDRQRQLGTASNTLIPQSQGLFCQSSMSTGSKSASEPSSVAWMIGKWQLSLPDMGTRRA